MYVELIGITEYLLPDTRHPEGLIEHAGRVCYRSEPRGNPAAFIRARLRDGHESIIEHASATFEISGISRACSHQLVRHRLASFSQESQRYVNQTRPERIIPPSIVESPEAYDIFNRLMTRMADAYRDLLALGISKEDARFLLPNATATRLVMTMNFRELLHFFHVRLDKNAQWEIREVAWRMLQIMVEESPAIFEELFDQVKGDFDHD